MYAFRNRFHDRSNTYHLDWYSNLILNAYINRHVHANYLKMTKFYNPFGIRHVFLYSIHQYLPHPVYEVPAIRLNTSKLTYTFTSVKLLLALLYISGFGISDVTKGYQDPWICRVCGKAFPFRSALERHFKHHDGYKPFVCEVCGRGFSSNQNFMFHKFSKQH